MIPLGKLRELFIDNYWARDRQLDVCAQLPPEAWLRPLGNSFPSVRDTLAHMAGAEWLYLRRCHGESPRALPPADEFPDVAAVRESWCETEHGFREYLDGVSESRLSEL